MAKKTIGARVAKLRHKKGVTQLEMSKAISVDRVTVSQWEGGARDLKSKHAVKLADYFNVTCDFLLRGIEAERIETQALTKLSNEAIGVLTDMASNNGVFPSNACKILDFLLCSEKFHAFLRELDRYSLAEDDAESVRKALKRLLEKPEDFDPLEYQMLVRYYAHSESEDRIKAVCLSDMSYIAKGIAEQWEAKVKEEK